MSTTYPHVRRVPVHADPLDVATHLVSSGVFQSHVVTERAGRVAVAGDVLAAVRHDRRGVHVTTDAGTRTIGGHGLRGVADALAELPWRDWRAYGWLAFEAGDPDPDPGPDDDRPLAHVVVPRCEVVVDHGSAVVRGVDAALVTAVCGVVVLARGAGPEPVAVPVDLTHGAERYRAAVATAVGEIRAGMLQKAIVSRSVPVDGPVDLPATWVHGRRGNTPVRSFLLDSGGVRAAGFSPEIVCESDGTAVTTQPLAGTRALVADEAVARGLRAELETDPKEIFEHAVSVKAALDELRGVCRAGTVRVEDFLGVQERGSVQHLASAVRGELAAGRDAWDALAAVFPAITASGIPKQAARRLVRRLEDGPRGLYAGAVLTVDDRGALDAALVLRTVFHDEGRTWLRAGAGVVAASTPERELEETCEKLRSVSRFLVPAAAAARRDGAA